MPNVIYITIREARDLPTTDARVQIKFADLDTMSTETATSQDGNPAWTDDTFKIELPEDRYVQDEPMRLEVLDSNLGADDIIGKVHLDLTCLCIDTQQAEHQEARMGPSSITGWFPIYDTLRGCCGELRVKVKTTFLAERNSFRDSSLGVLFFAGGTVPPAFPDYEIKGFVEELFIEDDPEEAWQDSFRSKRNSNERRLRLFTVLSGKVRRFVGKKTCELEGNAVLGYSLHFDLDKLGGFVIARGTGTAIRIEKKQPKPRFSLDDNSSIPCSSPRVFGDELRLNRVRSSGLVGGNRDNSVTITRDTLASAVNNPQHGDIVAPVAAQSQSVQILTLKCVPEGYKTKLGGLVTAHAVKLLVGKRTGAKWDGWWKDVRDEVKTHAQALGCTHVLGYFESCAIHGDLCIISGSGTAGTLEEVQLTDLGAAGEDVEHTVSRAPAEFSLDGASTHSTSNSPSDCSCFHVPYNTTTVPFPMRPVECKLCHECHVPEMLFGTIEPPSSIPCVGEGVLINAQVARRKLYPTGEKSAQYASDQIPFMTHNLHRQLVYKLKLHGCNVLFGLRIQLDIGDELLVAQATATGFCVPSLPLPRPLEIRSRQRSHSDLSSKPPVHQLDQIKHSLEKMSSDSIARQDKLIRNTHWVTDHPVDLFVLPKPASTSPEHSPSSPPLSRVQDPALETPDLSAELTNVELEELDLNDDVDHDLMAALQDAQLPEGFSLRTVESLPSTQPELARMRNVQMISMVRRVIWERSPHKCDERFSKLFREVVQAIACRVQPMFPCCVTGLRSQVDLSSANEVQITVTGMVLQQMESSAAPTESPTPQRPSGLPEAAVQRVASEDLLGEVASDEDEFIVEVAQESDFSTGCGSRVLADNVVAMLDDDAARVELTPLSFIPGMRTRNQGRLGYVSLVLIKEVVKGASPAAGGLKANCFTTMAEAHSMLRSIVLSRGGNTLLNFRMQECVILQTKQDMYALLHFYGDAAKVEPL